MFPYKDDNPTVLTPFMTVGIIAATSAIWILYQGGGAEPRLSQSVCDLGAIPARLFGYPVQAILTPRGSVTVCGGVGGGAWHTIVSSVFLHGGWFHLIGNMWFLWIFGNNIEDAMGPRRFVAFYLLAGVLAALAQIFSDRSSSLPLVGASGAVSAIMGAYVVLYPKVRVHSILVLGFFITRISLPAYVMLLYWAALQMVGSLVGGQSAGGVAFVAHLGGFAAGVVMIKLFTKPDLLAAARRQPLMFTTSQPWRY